MANDSGHDPAPDEIDDFDQGETLKGLRPGLRVFDRYLLQRQLGKGGMGVVWLAEDAKLEIEVALKFLPDAVVHDAAALDDLRQETRRCLSFGHPHVVRVYDLAGDAERAAIVMEHIDGETLSRRRVEQPHRHFEAAEIAVWMRQLCEALAYAHGDARVVHRDLKPSNLMLTARGQLKVMDFGIASSLANSMTRLSRPGAAGGTVTGGTLAYMSPQQLHGETPAVSDDIYSLGATIYELLTSKPPFFRGELLQQIKTVVPPGMAERRVQLEVEGAEPIPAAWEETVAACLAKDPKDRPKSAAEVWARLSDSPTTESQPVLRQDTSIPLPPRRKSGDAVDWKMITTVAVMAGLVVGLGLWWALKDDGSPQKRDLVAVKESDKPSPVKPATPTAEIVDLETAVPESVDLETGAIGDAREFDLGGGEKLVMKYVPGGSFTMGSPPDERFRNDDENQVSVTLTSNYWMGETEVTQGQWKAVMGSNPSTFTGDENLPVEMVSWDDVQAYIAKLNERGGLPTGWAWSLPTEAQWERACRAGTDTVFAFGNSLSSRQANFDGISIFGGNETGIFLGKTTPVKSYEPNAWGLYDMHGNVWEWCEDAWDGESTLPGGTDPLGTNGPDRVFRGGGYYYEAWICRAAVRDGGAPSDRDFNTGFRVSLSSRGAEVGSAATSPASSAGGGETGLLVKPNPTSKSEPDLDNGAVGDSRKFDLGGGETLLMKYVPGGTFMMGSPPTEEGREENENQVSVTLSSHYWLGETEVTQGQWEAVMGTNPSQFNGDKQLPVENVSWADAVGFAAKLNERGDLPSGWALTLPTEAQWERACRAGTETAFAFGTTMSSRQANFAGGIPYQGAEAGPELFETTPVKSYQPNDWGLYDMHGNVSEWCQDAHDEKLIGGTDPVGLGRVWITSKIIDIQFTSDRGVRGGDFLSFPWLCRAASRSTQPASFKQGLLGFRVALTAKSAQ